MPHNLLDLSLLFQIIQRLPCKTTIDLKPVDEGGNCDEPIGLGIFVEFVGGGFVKDDSVIGFVLNYIPAIYQWMFLQWLLWGCQVIPFPFDHFFFCFLPPVAAGACANL
jgi:hypothetical protein